MFRSHVDSQWSHAESGGLWHAAATHQCKATCFKPYLLCHPKESCCFSQELLREGVLQELFEWVHSRFQWRLQIRLSSIPSSLS